MNISITQTETFWQYFYDLIDLNLYQHKFLREDFKQAKSGNQTLYDRTFLNVQGNSWILMLELESIHIYGQNWSIQQVDEFLKNFDASTFENRFVCGETRLLFEIFRRANTTNYEQFIDRIFYVKSKLNAINQQEETIRLARIEEVPVLGRMLQQFYHEEYEGKNDKLIEEMECRMIAEVERESVYVHLTSENVISSFCTINNPDIGILYTNPVHRRKGYAKKILSFCTEQLFLENQEAHLMTMRNKVESNSTAQSIGYTPYFEFCCVHMKKD